MQPGTRFKRPPEAADWVQLDDPALTVFTDFEQVQPRTVHLDKAIDAALERMQEQGVRYCS